MCPRWHSRGFCFIDCYNSDSHVESKEVPEEKNEAYDAYLQKAGVKGKSE
jgi:Leu/Phe-tRNA-protein transferase